MLRVSLYNYTKSGRLFRNLLALRPVFEYASESDAATRTRGTFRYMIGVQCAMPAGRASLGGDQSSGGLEARLIELDSLIRLLPAAIVAPPAV